MSIRFLVPTAFALGLAASAFAPGAMACSDLSQLALGGGTRLDSVARFAASPGLSAGPVTAGAPDTADQVATRTRSPIVGFWKFAFTAPDGTTTIDAGFQQWHDDGTEITNSGRPAITGNFCLGTWKQRGSSYQLNHWAMAWDPNGDDPLDFGGLINIRETVDVNSAANRMTGTVTLDLYTPDGATLLAHLAEGTVSATRITP